LKLPVAPRAGLRRVTKKGGRKREGSLCNIIGCVAGLVLAGEVRACPLGGYKRGAAKAPCPSPRSWGSQPGAAGTRQPAPQPQPGDAVSKHHNNQKVRATQGAVKAGGEKEEEKKEKGVKPGGKKKKRERERKKKKKKKKKGGKNKKEKEKEKEKERKGKRSPAL